MNNTKIHNLITYKQSAFENLDCRKTDIQSHKVIYSLDCRVPQKGVPPEMRVLWPWNVAPQMRSE